MTLPWIVRAPGAPYFMTETGEPWTPIGQNDAINWLELNGLYRRRDLPGVRRHLRWLADHGVAVLRLMLEYTQNDHRYFEKPFGTWNASMVQLWDDLFALCDEAGLRILLTPNDTFFTWIRWHKHPWNEANGGPCPSRTMLLTHPGARAAMKARLQFATERWGGSGVLFAWDLYNEMHPSQGEENAPHCFNDYINDVGPWLRTLETRLHGRAHLQCVSVFGPELEWKPWIVDPIFRNPNLDFASSHFYEEGTIDHPRDTVAPALAMAKLTVEALSHIGDGRPFVESEHGPIHTFKDKKKTLPEPFDDEYFRHMQWAHLASGGAGGGMRWPNRRPHKLTDGMRRAQRAMNAFLPLIDWLCFSREPLNSRLRAEGCANGSAHGAGGEDVAAFGCGDDRQAVVWLLRRGPLGRDGRLLPTPAPATVDVPGLCSGSFTVTSFDTTAGTPGDSWAVENNGGPLRLHVPPFRGDVALAVRLQRPSRASHENV